MKDDTMAKLRSAILDNDFERFEWLFNKYSVPIDYRYVQNNNATETKGMFGGFYKSKPIDLAKSFNHMEIFEILSD